MPADLTPLTIGSTLGIAFGLALLARGMAGQRRAARIGDTASSTISAIAVGEVRISGVVEPAELTLTSPLQSRTCVYYRAKVERVEGRLRADRPRRGACGRLPGPRRERRRPGLPARRPVPRPGRVQGGDELHGRRAARAPASGTGSAFQAGLHRPRDPDRRAADGPPAGRSRDADDRGLDGRARTLALSDAGQARLSRGADRAGRRRDDRRAWRCPFDQLADPTGADSVTGERARRRPAAIADPEIAADLAEARAAGLLETDPPGGLGQRRDPGLRDRPPVAAARARSGGRLALPIATRRRGRAGRADLRRSNPRRWSSPPRPKPACSCRSGHPALRSPASSTGSCVGLLGAILAIASAVDAGHRAQRGPDALMPFAVAAWFAVWSLVVDRRVHGRRDLQRRRSRSIQRIDKAWANIDVALKQRHDELPNLVDRRPRRDGLRAGGPRGGHPSARRLRPGSPGPRAGCAVGRDEPGRPLAVRRRRELPAAPVGRRTCSRSRPRSSGSRASSPTGASSTTTRSTATTRGSPRSRRSCSPACSAGVRRDFFAAEDHDRARPDVSLRTA